MLEISIPGAQTLRLMPQVVDFNGTLACDGALLRLAGKLAIPAMPLTRDYMYGD